MSQRYIGGLIYNPPGGFSGYFDGSGDYLDAGTNAAFAVGTGNFTIELWVFPTAFSGVYTGYFTTRTGGQGFDIQILNSSATLMLGNNSGAVISANNVVVLNTWQHICAVRSGTTNSLYVNGVRVATGTDSTNFTDNGAKVGSSGPSGGNNGTGYISNVRLVKGTAVYDPTQTTITVPSGPLQTITNTSLLTCAYPTFRDGSSNNFTITVNGNTAVSTQNPFPQTQLPNPALGNQGNGVYSMSQYQALRSQNLWPAIDPYFDYVTLMLHGNGTNGAQNNTFLDSSTNNFTITRNGNTTQGTFTPFGSNWGNYFGATGQYLSVAYSSAFNLTGDFTIECWINPGNLPSSIGTAAQSYERVFSFGTYNAANSLGLEINSNDSGNLRRFISWYNGTSYGLGSNNAVAPGNWYHIAMVRSGTTITLYLNGTSIGTITGASAAVNTSQAFYIASLQGFEGDASAAFNGYISNFRIVKSAVYTSNFTPSASPLTAITNTVLLTCQDNRFRDNSTNNATVSVAGSPSVQRFSPFNPSAAYSAATIGGSGYFDGSGDFLLPASNAAFNFGTGDFTVEAWVYQPASGVQCVYDSRGSDASSAGFFFGTISTNFVIYTGGATVISTAMPLNAWTHFAVARSGSTWTLYKNGVSAGTYSSSANLTDANRQIGASTTVTSSSANYFTGYISDLRVVKGTAVYTTTFTPPTAPLTAITNTSLLLNFTNGGIIDNAMMNDLETVGNAQISTSVSKFGGGSMYFASATDWLTTPYSATAEPGSGNLTWEMWINTTNSTQYATLYSRTPLSFATGMWSLMMNFASASAGDLALFVADYSPSSPLLQTSGVNVRDGAWHHIAVVRNGSAWTIYVDGISRATNTWSGAIAAIAYGPYIARDQFYGRTYVGYIDDLRITRGYARYTANFTPQRSQWQDQ